MDRSTRGATGRRGLNRRGFTLVELIVVTVLGSLVLMASLQILITNQRTFTAQNAKIIGQQSTRAALDVLVAELREISAAGGDLIVMAQDSVRIRAMRKFGITCAVDLTGDIELEVIRVGDFFAPADSVFVFADNDEALASDDTWISTAVTLADTESESCNGFESGVYTFDDPDDLFVADSVRAGAPVRSYEYYTYRLVEESGSYYLGRRDGSSSTVYPLVGPLDARLGVQFAYRDASGATTTTSTDVRQIVITLRSNSGVRNSVGTMVSDSITAWVFTRN